MESRSLTLILPAYNEEARLGAALDELYAYLQTAQAAASLPEVVRVLVVDDGSTDGTAAIVHHRHEAERASDATVPAVTGQDPTRPSLAILSIPHGGKGAAVRAGMLAADTDLVVFADADMATPPDQIPLLVSALADHDVAIGSRIQPDGSDMRATQPRFRRMLGAVFHGLASAWVVGPVQDTQCGLKGFTRAAAHDLFRRQRITSIVFDVEIIHLAEVRGYRMAVVPIRWSDRRGSRMRTRPLLAARVAWDLLRIPLIHRRDRRRATTPAG